MASPRWIELDNEKQWSRLLYPNPVCFLSTVVAGGQSSNDDNEEESVSATHDDPAPQATRPHLQLQLHRNVMVLSWLSATNNKGSFMMSLNTRRYSARMLVASRRFGLSVPTRDLEDLVLQVGSVSGFWGVSKFEDDHQHPRHQRLCDEHVSDSYQQHSETSLVDSSSPQTKLSHSKRQKQRVPRYPNGIPGLRAVALGTDNPFQQQQQQQQQQIPSQTHSSIPFLFAIEGTIAHLQCRVTQVLEQTLDAEHMLVLAQVEQAWVHKDYWNASKSLFAPTNRTTIPYLTFLGSQTFGYVMVAHDDETVQHG